MTLPDFGAKYLALAAAGLAVTIILSARIARKRSPYPLPPSPPGELLIGHLRTVPTENPQLAYMKWGKEYSRTFMSPKIIVQKVIVADTDILYFQQGTTPVVVLNSVKAADELLSKRGANYSDRPRFVLFEV